MRRRVCAVWCWTRPWGYTGDLPALPPYLHVLGANETGLAVLRCARQAALLPLSHSLADLAARSAPAARVAAAHAAAEDLTALCLHAILRPWALHIPQNPCFPQAGRNKSRERNAQRPSAFRDF